MKKQNLVLVIIVAFILTVSVGYAVFNENIVVDGTASASGKFNIIFKDAVITSEVGSTGSLAEINNDVLEITVPKLEYPGAYVLFEVTVQNTGTIPATLLSIDKENLTTDNNVKISYEGLDELINTEIIQNGTQSFTIKVMWDVNSTAASSNVNFSIKLNYQQVIPNS